MYYSLFKYVQVFRVDNLLLRPGAAVHCETRPDLLPTCGIRPPSLPVPASRHPSLFSYPSPPPPAWLMIRPRLSLICPLTPPGSVLSRPDDAPSPDA